MRREKFKQIEDRFIKAFKTEAKKINIEFDVVRCRADAIYPPEDDPGFGCFSLQLSCLFERGGLDGTDNLALEIEAYDWNEQLTIDSLISWGHPSGKIEAELFERPVSVKEETLQIIQDKLPELFLQLRQIIKLTINKA